MKDPYEVLGVEKNADKQTIKRAYRTKAKKYHPDLNPGDEAAAEKFKELSSAYDILQDDEKRQMYDRYGAAAFENGGMGGGGFSGGFGFDPTDIFGDLFSDLFGGGGRQRRQDPNAPRVGEDVRLEVKLTFKEAVFGTTKKIKLRRFRTCDHCHGNGAEPGSDKKTCPTCQGSGMTAQEVRTPFGRMVNQTTCPHCHGEGFIIEKPCKECHGQGRIKKETTISVDIPAGVDDGNILPIRGQGHEGLNGGAAGDIYVVLRVAPSEVFTRRGSDLYLDLPIRFSQAALGDKIQVPGLEGKLSFDLPAGTQTGTLFTIKKEGVPNVRSGHKGDLHFRVNIVTPKKLNSEQKDALRAFQTAMGEESEESRGFWDKVKDIFD